MANIAPAPVDWLWGNRIPIGKLTIIPGNPGLGKSMATLSIAAKVSRGAALPGEAYALHEPGGVILLTAEDDLADTVRPRLDAHGADCNRIHALTSFYDLGRDVDKLRQVIESVDNCRLVIVDPISAYMGRADSHKDAEVRGVIAPLAALAAEKRVAVVAVAHLRKAEGEAIHRTIGSVGFVAAARSAWAVVCDPANPRRRLFLPVKNNLAHDVGGLAFTIERHGPGGAPVVCWEHDPVYMSADDAMSPHRRRGPAPNKRDQAASWLLGIMANGPRPASEVVEAAKAAGFKERTVERAFKQLGGQTSRDGFGGSVVWSFSPSSSRTEQPGEYGENDETWRVCSSNGQPYSPPTTYHEHHGENDDSWREWLVPEENATLEQPPKPPDTILAKFLESGNNLASVTTNHLEQINHALAEVGEQDPCLED